MKKQQTEASPSVPGRKWLNDRDAASFLGIAAQTLRKWRYANRGPRGFRVGTSVRYSVEDLQAWLDSRPTFGGGEE
jgi:predicted DNA-binding transcriptional regulator AlpA